MAHTSVTVVTERACHMGDTQVVNMVQRVRKNTLLEPGDTE